VAPLDATPDEATLNVVDFKITLDADHPTGTYDYFVYLTELDEDDFSTNFQSFRVIIESNTAPIFS